MLNFKFRIFNLISAMFTMKIILNKLIELKSKVCKHRFFKLQFIMYF